MATPGRLGVIVNGRKTMFVPTGALNFRGRGARAYAANRRLWSGPAADAGRLFVGLDVFNQARWSMSDVMEVVRSERIAQTGNPDSTFIAQKGIFKHASGEIVEEDSVQVIIYNLEEGVDYETFKEHMVALGSRLASVLRQELVVIEMRLRGVSEEVIGVGP